MRWNISAWSIRNPVPTVVLFLMLTVAGVAAFLNLSIAAEPDIDVPAVSVTVSQLGAAPSELETQVTRKIEDAVVGLGNVKRLTSTVNDGSSTTRVEFFLGTNTDRAVNDVRDAVTKIRAQLPQSIDPPVVRRNDEAGGPILGYTVYSKQRSNAEISWLTDNTIARAILTVPGVSRVYRSGGVTREVRVELNPNRLQALGVTADQLNGQIRALNIDLPGGRGEVGPGEQAIRTLGSAATVERLAATQILLPDGRYARLDTLGRVLDGTTEPRQIAYLDGKPGVAFEVVRSKGSNLVNVEAGVEKKVAELKKILPADIRIDPTWTVGDFVRESYEASVDALLLGAALAVVVIWVFLRDWRSTLIAGLAMPLSAIPTFAVMKTLGFTLNSMTLLALALVIGILVDDAIVEIENIVRHIAMGKPPYQAALDAADEIGLAVVATTMTIVAVFVPVAFMGGIQGQYYRQFGITVAAAVLFSLVVARMLTPLLAAYLMKPLPEAEGKGALARLYDRFLGWAIDHRFITLAVAGAFFAGSLTLFQTIPTSLIGSVDDNQSTLAVELPPGATFAQTRQAVERVNAIVMGREEVSKLETTVGTYDNSGKINEAKFYISLKPKSERQNSKQKFEAAVREQLIAIPGVRFAFSGGNWDSIKTLQIVLKSDDSLTLRRTAAALTDQMRSLPGLTDVSSSAAILRPEIQVRPKFDRAAELGVSVQAIARTALIATLGDREADLAKFNLPGRQINIRVQLDPAFRGNLEAIRDLRVASASGELVPLKAVAEVHLGSGSAQIDRYDRARQVTVGANLLPGTELGPALAQVHQLPVLRNLPAGVSEQLTGDAENQRDVFEGFGFAIGAAVLLIYAVLVLLFGGFLHPLTIMVSLPLSLGGVVLGLLLFGKSLGLYALIGIIMLMGLVTKNAILLVEYGLMAIEAGQPRRSALLQAGESRMRPILMTTIAMIAGMLPIALGLGAGSEVRSPMAVAVVGGLVTSTLLTLIVVPVVFTCIDDLQQWLLRLAGGTPKASPEAAAPAQQQ
ncbi:efflux RND transporter permease subunit [Gloeobacter morelensis]|uniref:Efflux RND transporter permease subunit n=1 Tax=Gloeobacter morelensis MG652769 TaxID=2781736 RepID=A0ABY3PSL5_9CYAN|nr:efflux RND transporter permease subunit [Gloeobacter morelensis]UFP96444.1 efflux RND transporter permease subunit [Gloeobacter morelensis MG652769]